MLSCLHFFPFCSLFTPATALLQEDQERIELQQRLALMVPTTAWLNPLPNDCMSDAELAAMPAPPARGEGSLEAAAAAGRRQQVT